MVSLPQSEWAIERSPHRVYHLGAVGQNQRLLDANRRGSVDAIGAVRLLKGLPGAGGATVLSRPRITGGYKKSPARLRLHRYARGSAVALPVGSGRTGMLA
jgi:hypothetical protein